MIQETFSDVGSKLTKGAKGLGSNIQKVQRVSLKLLTKEYKFLLK